MNDAMLELAADAADAMADFHIAAVNAEAFDTLLDYAYQLSDIAEDIETIARAGLAGGKPLAKIVMGLIVNGAEVDLTIIDLSEGTVGPDARAN